MLYFCVYFLFSTSILSYVQKPYFTNELLFREIKKNNLATRQLILQLKSDLKKIAIKFMIIASTFLLTYTM